MEFIKANLNNMQIVELIKLYFTDYKDIKVFDLGGVANNNYRIKGESFDVVIKVYSHGQSNK